VTSGGPPSKVACFWRNNSRKSSSAPTMSFNLQLRWQTSMESAPRSPISLVFGLIPGPLTLNTLQIAVSRSNNNS